MKIFETEQDLVREKKAIEKFAEMKSFKFQKLDKFDIDYKILDTDGSHVGYAEVKGRIRFMRDAYPLPVSVAKVVKLLAKRTDCWLIWACDDGIIYGDPKELVGDLRWGGTTPRPGSYNDLELMAYYDKQKALRYVRY